MKITALSRDSQLAILCQVSSQTLLTSVALVCTQWNQLQPYACRQRRTLKLAIHWNLQPDPTDHFTLYPATPLNASYVVALSATFPRVTHLVIDHWNFSIDELDQQLYLLQSWTSTLVSLQLTDVHRRYPAHKSPQFSAFFDRLLAHLNQMPHLKRLGLVIIGPEPPSADLSILRRLVSIKLHFDDFDHHLVPQLLQHCSPNLQHLSMGIHHFTDFVPLLTSPAICSKLELLTISDHLDATQLSITIDQCTNLRSLALSLPTLELYTDRLHPLTKLPRLTDLSLRLVQLPIDGHDPVLLPTPLPVLSSIRRLNIYARTILPSHEHLVQVTQLDKVFPQLQQIHFYFTTKHFCQQCTTNGSDPSSCIDAILRPLAHLETLQVAKAYLWGDGWQKAFNWLPRLRSQ